MKAIGYILVYAGMALLVTTPFGCASGPRPDERAPAPEPPPPADQRPAATIHYPHEVRRAPNTALGRKLVIGLARLATDRDLEDAPFGDDEPEAPEVETNVRVDMHVGIHKEGDATARSTEFGPFWRRVLKHELLETGAFVLVERDGILDVLREIKFGESRYVDSESRPAVGEIIAVQYLLEASIGGTQDPTFKGSVEALPRYDERSESLSRQILAADRGAAQGRLEELRRLRLRRTHANALCYEYPYSAYLSLYSVRTGEIAAEVVGIGATPLDALRGAIEDLVDACVEIAPPPRIAWVDGERVFIDVGSDGGVVIGQRFRYTGEGQAIRNAAGQVIGHDTQAGGLLEVTRVEPLMSTARVVEREREPGVGDLVEKQQDSPEGAPESR